MKRPRFTWAQILLILQAAARGWRWPFLFIFLFPAPLLVRGQDKNTDTQDRTPSLEERFKLLKDSLTQLQPLIPAVSSVLIDKNQVEINFFNALISTDKIRNGRGNLESLQARQSYFYSGLQLTYGISAKARVNIGLEVNFTSGRYDQNPNSSPLSVFRPVGAKGNYAAQGITSFGPRLRWRPFKTNYRLTLQSSILWPGGGSAEKDLVLGAPQINLLTHLLYNQPLSRRFFLFGQLGLQHGIRNSSAPPLWLLPLTGYICYFIPAKTILYGSASYLPVFRKRDKGHPGAYNLQTGLGLQHQFSGILSINGFFATNVGGKNYQDFNTCSLGMRLIL